MMKTLVNRLPVLALALLLMLTAFTGVLAEDSAMSAGEVPAVEAKNSPAENVSNVTDPVLIPSPSAEFLEELMIEPVLSVTSNLEGATQVFVGTEMVLTLTVEGLDGYAYTIQWQQSTDGGETWTDISGENDHQLIIILDVSHTDMYWRACVEMVAPEVE